MTSTLSRRSFAAATIGVAFSATSTAKAGLPTPVQGFSALEAQNGGKLGVVAVETRSGRRISYRAAERFPMCSTHKLLTAAAVLAMVDRGEMSLNRRVPYGKAQLLEYAPITRKNVGAGFMTVGELCSAAIDWSDNTAENLLLSQIGGPAGWTHYARSIGDTTSRLDRNEPTLNTAIPGDLRDTTTPNAMVANLYTTLLGKSLSKASRSQLLSWLLDSQIDGNLLRAGLPSGWRIGDKSGSGARGTRNDIGIIFRPNAGPVLTAVFYTGSSEPLSMRERVIANVGRIIAKTYAI